MRLTIQTRLHSVHVQWQPILSILNVSEVAMHVCPLLSIKKNNEHTYDSVFFTSECTNTVWVTRNLKSWKAPLRAEVFWKKVVGCGKTDIKKGNNLGKKLCNSEHRQCSTYIMYPWTVISYCMAYRCDFSSEENQKYIQHYKFIL